MRLRSMLLAVVGAIVALLLNLVPGVVPTAMASNSMNQLAVLETPDAGAEISVYAKPGRQSQKIGYGLGGDRVTVLEQVGSDEGYTWNYIRFENPPHAEGWVRTDHLSFQLLPILPIATPQLEPIEKPIGYLGDRPISQNNAQTEQQLFSQQQMSKPLAGVQKALMNWFKRS